MIQTVSINIPLDEYENLQKEWIKECLKSVLKDTKKEEQNSEKFYLTIDEVCQRLKISAPTLNSYTKKGFLKSYKIGSRVLYKFSEIDSAISSMSNSKLGTTC